MSLTKEERLLLDTSITSVTDLEVNLIESTLQHMFNLSKEMGITLKNDDRCASFEAAMIKFIISSR